MKRFIVGLTIGLSMISCDSKSDKNDDGMRNQALLACETEAITSEMSPKKKELVKEYCSCATDKMLEEFTYAEMMQMNNPSKELQDRLMEFVKPCLQELKTKSDELGE